MSPEEREALRALHEATNGPWMQGQAQDGEMLPDGTGYAGDYEPTADVVAYDDDGYCTVEFGADTPANAAFIVAAHRDVPRLLAEVESLRAALDRAQAEGTTP